MVFRCFARRALDLGLLLIAAGFHPQLAAGQQALPFAIGELEGAFLGENGDEVRRTTVLLQGDFTQILGATLQLSGSLAPGTYADLNREGEFPLTAGFLVSLPGVAEGTFYETYLAAEQGAFDLEIPFVATPGSAQGPDFSAWISQGAQLEVAAVTPLMIGTTVFREQPALQVDAATLWVDVALAAQASYIDADFNGDGRVDARDFEAWQAADSSSALADANQDGRSDGKDLLDWQRSFGVTQRLLGIPEPTAASLLAALLLTVLAGRRTFL